MIDYLDTPASTALDLGDTQYIETQLQHNQRKFIEQANLCCDVVPRVGVILDVGCGGGAFLKIMRNRGYYAEGIEVHPLRRAYCQNAGLTIHDTPVETWPASSRFDLITLWDVIEHVNDPRATLEAAFAQLKVGGVVILDTPSRDALFYRFGELTSRLSGGRWPTLLGSMYSAQPFGHKQIFSDRGMEDLLHRSGFRSIRIFRKFELSFPVEFYLRRLLRNETLARACALPARALIAALPVRNKVVAIGKKFQ
ncbi:MAG TPA: class I SAM-dependent methyltransferase [Gemmatimonadales bacterium]